MSERWDEGVVVTAPGRHVGYLCRGPAQGKPVVYLHGLPGSRRQQCLIPDAVLHRFGVRLVSPDRPGHGATDTRTGDRMTRVADVLDLCDALGIGRFPVVAVSAGGSYALALASIAADRVERVVLVSAQMPYDDESVLGGLLPNQRNLLPILRASTREELLPGFEDARARLLADPLAGLAEIVTLTPREQSWLAPMQQLLVDDVRTGLAPGVDGFIDDIMLWPHPFEVDMTSLSCPVRAIHGMLDDAEPLSNLQRILAQIPDTQLFLVDGLSHLGPLMYPDVVMGLLADD